ncbi:MAG: bifunctional 5,10-methylenetetrahydrofolate dehydrogenase/5,10-methenyltetrahydrofolate cyclohydrolase [bacterium]
MVILDGKKLAEEILTNLKSRGKKLKLAVVLVGGDSIAQIFINQKRKACEKIGVNFELFKFPTEISGTELRAEIKKIVSDSDNSGVVIQLPLPEQINDVQEILNLVPPKKDVDVLSEESLGKFSQGTLLILPPTVSGISHLLERYRINIKGKNIVIVGAGRLVGYPLALGLLRQNATVTVLNRHTQDLSSFTKKADILISGVGKPSLIKGNMVKKGVVVIDAGSAMEKRKAVGDEVCPLRGFPSSSPSLRLVGDVDFQSVSKKASYITPVPGGVGPLTVACLLDNLVELNK